MLKGCEPMSEWWTYRPSSFLMFSARTYARLVESYNRELWPLHAAMVAAGIALLWLSATRPREGARAVAGVLALAWLWVGWAFHWQRYVQINTVGPYLALVFAVEAVLLLVLGLGRPGHDAIIGAATRRVGWALAGCAVLLYPLLTALTGRWQRAEVFGLMPDPTALATLGLLLATNQRHRRVLAVIPALSLMLGWMTWWLMLER
jgi:hypothetical protein